MAIQPPQRFELDDLTHVEREARTIYAPGATPGDVLVVQADHSLIAAPGGGSQPVTWVGPFPVTYADFQPAFQTILADAAPYAGKLLIAASIFLTADWNDSGTPGLNVYVADPANESFAIDNLIAIDLKSFTVAGTTDAQGNRSGVGAVVIGTNAGTVAGGFWPAAPVILQTPILVGSGSLNKLIAYFGNGNNDGTTGGADIYLCFATPVAP